MPPRTVKFRAATVVAVLALGTLLAASPQSGAVAAEPAPVTDYCQGQCDDILPPGENGNATLVDILGNKAFGTHPAHSDDQLDRYNGLVAGHTGLTDQKLTDFFNDASFGVPENQVESVTSPRDDVTITRDKASGVPHIKGTTRYGTEFGAGFAAGQDRLWLMDLFRHIGRGELTSFAGGALANQGLEQQFWPQAPYTEADLEAQVAYIRTHEGARGEQAMADAQAYIDGINAYREKSKKGRYFPGEYVLTGKIDAITNIGEIQPFKLTDLISIASVVGGQFGGGGGGEVQAALSLLSAHQKYGVAEGSQRKESSTGSHAYTHADAVRIMDAWWPKLVEAEFKPGLGDGLYGALTANLATDESPAASHGPSGAHSGSAFQYGWWGFVDKDLRRVLGQPVKGPLAKAYCGNGDPAGCRDVLLASLKAAAAEPAAEVYPGDDSCKAGEQWCTDSIVHRPLGGIAQKSIHWQNRPTYQQVVEFPAHR
ncbi:penicillin acylase family protein [Streptomyces sp. NPDC088246]|uniref:penicillin acylase family protein n=1 Tax=Streptomyces sp. NPDC088246 TaxID=3365842 RepID=UPI003826745F